MRAAAEARAEAIAQEIVNEARANCPVDNGALRASISSTVAVNGDRCKITVGSPLEYAAYVHEGTGIYGPKNSPIVPVSRDFLRFIPKGGSEYVFARSVKGMKPRPFLADAIQTVMGNITRRNTR